MIASPLWCNIKALKTVPVPRASTGAWETYEGTTTWRKLAFPVPSSHQLPRDPLPHPCWALLLVTCEQTTTAAMNWWVEWPCHVQRALCAWPSPLSSHSTGHAFIAGPHRTSSGLTSHSLTASNLNLNLLFHIETHHDLSLLYFAVGTLKPEYTTSNVFYRGIWVLASTDNRRLLWSSANRKFA